MKTNEGLVGANGKQNKLDGVMFLDLTLGLRTHQVTCLFLFPETCKELRIHCSERPREAPTCTAPAHPPRSTNDAPAPRTGLYDAPPLPQHLRCPSPLRQPLEPPPAPMAPQALRHHPMAPPHQPHAPPMAESGGNICEFYQL